MSPAGLVLRVILALCFPPISVIGMQGVGCGTILLLCLLTLIGFLPGTVAAMILIVKEYSENKL